VEIKRAAPLARLFQSSTAPEEMTTEELEELRRLRRESRILKMERDFAKKAAAFFAKDLDPPSS